MDGIQLILFSASLKSISLTEVNSSTINNSRFVQSAIDEGGLKRLVTYMTKFGKTLQQSISLRFALLKQLLISADKFQMMKRRFDLHSLQTIPLMCFPLGDASGMKRTNTIASKFHRFNQ